MAELHAWVDESGSDKKVDPHTYILAAALCAQDAMDDVRAQMRALRTGSAKVHWSDENKPARRHAITAQVIASPIDHLSVVREGLPTDTHRRPRRAALKELLHELDRLAVTHAILESRGPADDARDAELHQRLRLTHRIDGRLKMSHTPGPNDPGLWVADAVCGAVSSARTGHPEYLEVLASRITMITIDHQGNRA